MRFVAIGDNCLDVYVQADRTYVGGNALNVAVNWFRSGRDARYLGAVGDDPAAAVVTSAVAGQGLDIADVDRMTGATGVTLIELHDGDRRFVHEEFGVGAQWQPRDAQLDTLACGDWVHLAGVGRGDGLVADLVDRGVRVSVDLSTFGDFRALERVDVAFASAPDGLPDAEALAHSIAAAGVHTAFVTAGSAGSVALQNGIVHRQPAEPVNVVDTCGAGDSYIAATVVALAEGASLAVAMERGAREASATCGHRAGFPQHPTSTLPWIIDTYYHHASASHAAGTASSEPSA